MALPKLSTSPKYEITIPSTGEKTYFRPYLVREERVLLIASESGDEHQISKAAIDVIKACVDKDINDNDITTYDMEYLFCHIRAKSVGETSKMVITCTSPECDHSSEVNIPLEKVEVDTKNMPDAMIKMTDNIFIEMKHMTYFDILNNKHLAESSDETEQIYHSVITSIKSIKTDEEIISAKDETYEDLVEFVNSLSIPQFAKLQDFVLNSPQIALPFEWTCEVCKSENAVELRGILDFF